MTIQTASNLKDFLVALSQGYYSNVRITDDTQTEMVGSRMTPTTLIILTAVDVQNNVILQYSCEDRTDRMQPRTPGLTSRKDELIALFKLHGYGCEEGVWSVKAINALLSLLD